jgi:Spy/CpxP family protein refolding chaperone
MLHVTAAPGGHPSRIEVQQMKNNDKERRPASNGLLLRGLFMAVAMAGSATAVYVMAAPSARAATQAGAPDNNASWFARMHGHSHAGMRSHFDGVLAQANVNAPQKQAIDRIVHDAMLAEHADMARYHAAAGELKQLLVASRIDETAVERIRTEQDRVAADASRTLTEAAVQVARLLTQAQRQAIGGELDRMMADVPGHHHGG